MYGTVHFHTFPGPSGESSGRRLRVWTPSGYAGQKTRRFPVLYLQDGQNVFSRPSSRSREPRWQADTTAQAMIVAEAIPPLILVGVDNAGAKRADDYTPIAWKGKGGRAADHAELLATDIKRFVDQTYRTRPGPDSTALGGSSLGGLFALYAGLRMPDVFGGVIAMSPSVYWGDDHILTEVEQSLSPSVRIWLDVGRHETATMRKGLRKLHRALEGNGWRQDRAAHLASLRVSEDAQGHHDETSWGRRFEQALRFLFPPSERRAPTCHGGRTSGEVPPTAHAPAFPTRIPSSEARHKPRSQSAPPRFGPA